MSMVFSFLVTLREGFEIALVIALALGYLARTGNRDHFREVWIGTVAAVGLTMVIGGSLQFTAAELSGPRREAFEGITMLAAVAVLTWMVFWMRRQSATLGAELRAHVAVALERGSVIALAGLAFSAVIREGIETVLFLFAGATAAGGDSAASFWLGGVAGFAVAGALGYIVYRGSHRLPLRMFFRITGILVLVLGAGLLSNGISELQSSGLIPNLGARPWDMDRALSLTTTFGRFLHTLFGYDPAPTWGQIVLVWGYLSVGLLAFLGPLDPLIRAAGPNLRRRLSTSDQR